MDKYKFYVLGNFSPNIRTFGKLKCTCYMLDGFSKVLLLDFGAGVFFKFMRVLRKSKKKLSDVNIFISHNHIDHTLSLFPLSVYLLIYNFFHKQKIKINIAMPKKSAIFSFISRLKSIYNVVVISNKKVIYIDDVKVTFCKTIHKGMSYATKFELGDKSFVYTSDIARYSNKLKEFVRDCDTVLIDAGYPHKKFKIYKNYHGITKEILYETSQIGVQKIYATHLRFFSNYEDYLMSFPKNANIEIVQIGDTYSMFKQK